MKSNYERQGIDVESCYRPGGGCDITPPKPPDPPNPRRDNPKPGYITTPDVTTDPPRNNPDPEAAARKAAEEAESKRKADQKFKEDQADAQKNLKGMSSGELKLKGMDTNSRVPKGTADTSLKNNSAAAKKCEARARAASEYPDLRQRVDTDEKIIRNFGFSQRAEDIEAWGVLSEKARKAYEKKAADMKVGIALDTIAYGIIHGAPAAPVLTQGLSESLIRMFKSAGIPESDSAYQIARKVGETITPERAEIVARRVRLVKDAYDKSKDVVGVVSAENSVELAGSILAVANWLSKNPAFQWAAAKDIDALSLAVFATQYNVAKHQINHITTLTEAELRDLDDYTTRLRNDMVALRIAEKTLKSSPPCDSTNLVLP